MRRRTICRQIAIGSGCRLRGHPCQPQDHLVVVRHQQQSTHADSQEPGGLERRRGWDSGASGTFALVTEGAVRSARGDASGLLEVLVGASHRGAAVRSVPGQRPVEGQEGASRRMRVVADRLPADALERLLARDLADCRERRTSAPGRQRPRAYSRARLPQHSPSPSHEGEPGRFRVAVGRARPAPRQSWHPGAGRRTPGEGVAGAGGASISGARRRPAPCPR